MESKLNSKVFSFKGSTYVLIEKRAEIVSDAHIVGWETELWLNPSCSVPELYSVFMIKCKSIMHDNFSTNQDFTSVVEE